MWRNVLIILVAIFSYWLLPSCKNGHSADQPIVVADTVFLATVSYSELFTDSSRLADFLKHQPAYKQFGKEYFNFYRAREYSYAWFTEDGISEQAGHFMNMVQSYAISFRDSSVLNSRLGELVSMFADETVAKSEKARFLEETELLLTLHFFEYSEKSYIGSKINPRDLSWFIPRKKIDLQSLLAAMTDRRKDSLTFREPVMRQYQLLKEQLVKYYTLEAADTIGAITMSSKKLEAGDTSEIVALIRSKLHLLGDISDNNGSDIYDEALVAGILYFQQRHGLGVDGVIGKQTLAAINVPVKVRIRQMLVNLERNRWVPYELKGDFLVVNIPEFTLHVHQDGKYAWNTPVIVGKAATNTVIFNAMLKYVVFSPYWNVPASIQRNEIEPAIRRNPGYLAAKNMERLPNGTIRQKPGPNNALGRVKFLFPNQYNIYLHDTPAKNLFNEPKRLFSHGCIRVKNPEKLAEFLLRDYPEWTAEAREAAMNDRKENWVTLKKEVPVFISYFTAWVDGSGTLQFREDVYSHDKRLEKVLFADKPIL
jgi:L,D-transpeptidase YcbB